MKKYNTIVICFIATLILGSCAKDFLETNPGTKLTQEMINSDYGRIWEFGYAPYTYLRDGFSAIDGNLMAAITDEAEQTATSSNAQLFNEGSWSAYNNPADMYANCYRGIRAATYFLDNFSNYKSFLAQNRDTLSDHQAQYMKDVQDIAWLRAESRVLRAWYYFELAKRYGGVPLVTKVLTITDNTNIPRSSFDDIINFVVAEIDAAKDSLQPYWKSSAYANNDGRIDLGAALAIKARALLYAASPLHNTTGDIAKWGKAAQAAYDVIALNKYSLDTKYRDFFVSDNTAKSKEGIWVLRIGATNWLEKQNYPIGTIGGNSGITPSQNLVDDYEYKGSPDPLDPYKNRDPRLGFCIAANNSIWNGRPIQIWAGGTDGAEKMNTSKTGYYLRKFLSDNLDLVQNTSNQRSWVIFRYADILLNYAEAMNEAHGPVADNGFGKTALDAINEVRNRLGVKLAKLPLTTTKEELRDKIKHERRIELAFEDHRYWDLIRWKDAETALNQPLRGIKAIKNADNTFTYTTFTVEPRVFTPNMYYFPIPQTEIVKSNGVLEQNPEW